MSDLIRREDTVSRISDLLICELQGKRLPTWNEVYHAINNIPSAEPERKKGEWVVKEEDWRKQQSWNECSECGFATSRQYNFCPNCGADMRGKNGKA